MDDNFIKLLDKSLSVNGFIIQKPMEYSDIRYLAIPNTKQYLYTFDDTTRNDDNAVTILTTKLLNDFRKDLTFVPLFLPNAALPDASSCLFRYNNLLARFIQNLRPLSDDIIYRWDILVRGEWR